MFVNALPFESVLRVWDCMFGASWMGEKAKSTQTNDIVVVFSHGGKIGLQFPKDVSPLVIGKIDPSGLAGQNPQLVPGLVLRTVQGQSVTGFSYGQTMEMMKAAGRPLRLTFTTAKTTESPRDVMMRIGIATLSTLQRPLLAAQNSQEVNQVLRNGVGKIFDADMLIKLASTPRWKIDPALREKHKQEIQNENKRVNDSRHQREQDAAERLSVNRASERLADQLHKGSDEDEKVMNGAGTCVARLMNNDVHRGSLFLTNYRLAFVSADLPADDTTIIDISLISIFKVTMKRSLKLSNGYDLGVVVLKVVSKDARILHFMFDSSIDRSVSSLLAALDVAKGGDLAAKKEAGDLARRIQHKHLSVTSSGGLGLMKMFSGKEEIVPETVQERKVWDFLKAIKSMHEKNVQMKHSFQMAPVADEAALEYSAAAEYTRLKALEADSGWRHCQLNNNYALCQTYPAFVVVPAAISDAEVREVTKFRSKGRLPALSWMHPDSRAAVVRCAQPLVGITGKKSPADEKLFYLMRESLPVKKPLLLLDARPYMNAYANKARKGGFEDISHYKGSEATLEFLNIENIHVMRDSLAKLHKLARSTRKDGVVRRQEIIDTGWLTHVGRVLCGAKQIVDAIDLKGRTCIVHCSDGWDRTAQLCALSEICLDPFYRTAAGFKVVVSREWLSFGHKFRDRTWGHKDSEKSPIFFQFLDTVHQLMYAHPKAFEFNEWYLLRITDALFGNAYSEFRFDNEREVHSRATAAAASCCLCHALPCPRPNRSMLSVRLCRSEWSRPSRRRSRISGLRSSRPPASSQTRSTTQATRTRWPRRRSHGPGLATSTAGSTTRSAARASSQSTRPMPRRPTKAGRPSSPRCASRASR